MKKTSPLYFLIDPSTNGYSGSRLLSVWFTVLITYWVIACVQGWPQKEAYTPVSAMLGACIGSALGAYALNSYGRVRGPRVGE